MPAPEAAPELPREAGEPSPATAADAAAEEVPPAPVPPPAGVVFQVNVDLMANATAPAARGLLVLRELERAGEVLNANPTKEMLRQGGECPRVQVWLRTVVPKARLGSTLRAMSDVACVTFVDDRRTSGGARAGEARSVRVRTDLLDQVVDLTGELLTRRFMLQRASANRDWASLDAVLGQVTRLIDDLHHQALQARMMPLESVAGRLPRLVRDLAQKSSKQVEFKLVGGGVELDRAILDELADPLMHLVRNAVDHGIVERGEVTVAARREKDLVLIEVGDDGRGIDPQELRRQAVMRGVLTDDQVAMLDDRDVLMLVCLPGFSTAREITETSGRGVGMDVVKSAVEKLGGTLEIVSAPGEGTTFQLRMPLAMAIIRILQVSCGGRPLALPATRVLRTLELPATDVSTAGGRRFCQFDGEELELVRLAELLGLDPAPAGASVYLALVEVKGRPVGVQVDRFLGQRNAFVKTLGFPLSLLPGISGATVEADGGVVFIIDPLPLLAEEPRQKNRPERRL